MHWRTKTGTGAVLGILGGVGMAVGPTLGAAELGRPWSFVGGFVVGLVAGIGVVLAVSGLVDRRRMGP